MTVSAIIPAHNAGATIERALRSVLAQDKPADEIIVVDDGSTDETADRVARYRERGVTFLHTAGTETADRSGGALGAAAARNLGVAAASGRYLAFLDADDEWHPAKLKLQLAAIEKDDRIVVVGCDETLVTTDGETQLVVNHDHPGAEGETAWRALLAHSFLHTSGTLVRAEAFAAVGGYDELLSTAEDQDLWIRLAMIGAVAIVPRPLVTVHRTEGSLGSGDRARSMRNLRQVIERHLSTQADKLTPAEVRSIRSRRYLQIGRGLCAAGNLRDRLDGASLLVRAGLAGAPVADVAAALLLAVPGMDRAKRFVRSVFPSRSRGPAG